MDRDTLEKIADSATKIAMKGTGSVINQNPQTNVAGSIAGAIVSAALVDGPSGENVRRALGVK